MAKMRRSFSIVDDEDQSEISKAKIKSFDDDDEIQDLNDSDSEEILLSKNFNDRIDKNLQKPLRPQSHTRIQSAGPSGRKTVIKSFKDDLSSESDISDDEKNTQNIYDPKQYENLDVSEEIKEIFQYIGKYTPQELNLDTKFKPFIPEFLPAVGDIDAFLKILPPEQTLSGETFNDSYLGLIVLDEPATNQSDPALLHLKLRANSVNSADDNHIEMVVKKVENVEKNAKTIDKWIKDISDLHKSKSSPTVRYQEPMPDLDDLMQEWPEDMEKQLKEHGFPKPETSISLEDYIEKVCGIFQIPCKKNKQHSLHLLFSLYAAIKNSQLFKTTTNNNEMVENNKNKTEADQLVLE